MKIRKKTTGRRRAKSAHSAFNCIRYAHNISQYPSKEDFNTHTKNDQIILMMVSPVLRNFKIELEDLFDLLKDVKDVRWNTPSSRHNDDFKDDNCEDDEQPDFWEVSSLYEKMQFDKFIRGITKHLYPDKFFGYTHSLKVPVAITSNGEDGEVLHNAPMELTISVKLSYL
jgi:hypothetical protein